MVLNCYYCTCPAAGNHATHFHPKKRQGKKDEHGGAQRIKRKFMGLACKEGTECDETMHGLSWNPNMTLPKKADYERHHKNFYDKLVGQAANDAAAAAEIHNDVIVADREDIIAVAEANGNAHHEGNSAGAIAIPDPSIQGGRRIGVPRPRTLQIINESDIESDSEDIPNSLDQVSVSPAAPVVEVAATSLSEAEQGQGPLLSEDSARDDRREIIDNNSSRVVVDTSNASIRGNREIPPPARVNNGVVVIDPNDSDSGSDSEAVVVHDVPIPPHPVAAPRRNRRRVDPQPEPPVLAENAAIEYPPMPQEAPPPVPRPVILEVPVGEQAAPVAPPRRRRLDAPLPPLPTDWVEPPDPTGVNRADYGRSAHYRLVKLGQKRTDKGTVTLGVAIRNGLGRMAGSVIPGRKRYYPIPNAVDDGGEEVKNQVHAYGMTFGTITDNGVIDYEQDYNVFEGEYICVPMYDDLMRNEDIFRRNVVGVKGTYSQMFDVQVNDFLSRTWQRMYVHDRDVWLHTKAHYIKTRLDTHRKATTYYGGAFLSIFQKPPA